MDYVSPYLQNTEKRFSTNLPRKEFLTAADIMSDHTLSISEKHHALDRLEHEALAALTMVDEFTSYAETQSPAKLLEDVIAAKRKLHHAS